MVNSLTVISGVPADIRRRERSLRQVEIKLCAASTFVEQQQTERTTIRNGTKHQTLLGVCPTKLTVCVLYVFFFQVAVLLQFILRFNVVEARSGWEGLRQMWMCVTMSCILNPQILVSPSVNLFGDLLGGRV